MKVECIADTVVCEIEIQAAPEAVFDALVTPQDLAAWWGAEGVYRTSDWQIDLRPGGKWSCQAASANGKMTVHGEYLEVERPRVLAYTWNPSWEKIPETTVRYRLDPVAGGTRLHAVHSGFAGFPDSQRGHSAGWERVLQWLAAFCTGKAVSVG